jgi:Putative beta barrel porin-7 (BBP7)
VTRFYLALGSAFVLAAAIGLAAPQIAEAQYMQAAAMDYPAPQPNDQQGAVPANFSADAMSSAGYCGPGGQCPNNGGCGNGCKPCYPHFYVEGGAVFLWRDNRSNTQPVVIDNTFGTTILNTQSAELDTGIGPEARIAWRTGKNTAWILNYFSAFDFDGQAVASGAGNLAAPGSLGIAGIDWGFADQMRTHYSSDLHSAEIDYQWCPCCCCCNCRHLALFGGFRFIDLDERYDITAVSGPDTSYYRTHTRNELYGGQVGGRYRHCCKDCCHGMFWEATGKAGCYGNAAEQDQLITDSDNTAVLRESVSHRSTIAFEGDANISIGWQICCSWAARFGYNAMWLNQVALAPDQLDFNLASAGTGIHTSGDVFLHGINCSLEGRW